MALLSMILSVLVLLAAGSGWEGAIRWKDGKPEHRATRACARTPLPAPMRSAETGTSFIQIMAARSGRPRAANTPTR